MRGLPGILSLFCNMFTKKLAPLFGSIDHMTFKRLSLQL